MNCKHYQQNILLMLHGELGFVDSMRVKAHLSRCADCRRKRDALASASVAIASGIRMPGMPRWSFKGHLRPRRSPSVRTVAGIIVVIGIGASLVATMVTVGRARSRPNHPKFVYPSTGCAPDLPSDRCR